MRNSAAVSFYTIISPNPIKNLFGFEIRQKDISLLFFKTFNVLQFLETKDGTFLNIEVIHKHSL